MPTTRSVTRRQILKMSVEDPSSSNSRREPEFSRPRASTSNFPSSGVIAEVTCTEGMIGEHLASVNMHSAPVPVNGLTEVRVLEIEQNAWRRA